MEFVRDHLALWRSRMGSGNRDAKKRKNEWKTVEITAREGVTIVRALRYSR